MGFKCPICFDDFGFDKPKWSEHLKTAHEGCGEDIVNAVLKITDEPNFRPDVKIAIEKKRAGQQKQKKEK